MTAPTLTRRSFWPDKLHLDEDGYFEWAGDSITPDEFCNARRVLGRNNGPALLFDLIYKGGLELWEHPTAVAEVWSMAEWPARNMPPNEWVNLFEEVGYLDDGTPGHPPTEGVTLYRGCAHEDRFGMSWTTEIDNARFFAGRWQRGANVYTMTPQPDWLLSHINGGNDVGRPGEQEYVVRPDVLDDSVVTLVEQAVRL